jgi:hypothetical protein
MNLRWTILISAVIVAAVACSGETKEATQQTTTPISISGQFVLTLVGDCNYRNPFPEISAGSQIIVRDEADTVIASGELEELSAMRGGGIGGLADCVFPFEIADVPEAAFYTIEIGDQRSPAIPHSRGGSLDICLEVSGAAQSLPPEPCTKKYP